MPEKKIKDLKSFIRSDLIIQQMKESDLVDLYCLPLEIALRHEFFKELKNLKEKSEWEFVFKIDTDKKKRFINLDDFKEISMTSEEITLIPPALRSYYPFYKIIKKKFQL